MYALYVCLVNTRGTAYMYALHVCLICMPYMCALHVCRQLLAEQDIVGFKVRKGTLQKGIADFFGSFF